MDLETYNAISDKINSLRGDSYTEFCGGGIVCIIVNVGKFSFWWGTANETWGADIYIGEEFQTTGLDTDLSCDETNLDVVAARILDESVKFANIGK